MANNDILQYLRKTPHNTNVNVVKGMIGNESESGAVEMTTVFDEDITFTYNQGNTYNPATGFFEDNREIILSHKYAKITLDDMTFKGLPFDSGDYIVITETNPFILPLSSDTYTFYIDIYYYYEPNVSNRINASVYGSLYGEDSNLQTYCQTPHHLKIELFNL